MNRIILILLSVLFVGFSTHARSGNDYSGTWRERDSYDTFYKDTYITLRYHYDGTHSGILVYKGMSYDIKCDHFTFNPGSNLLNMKTYIYHRGEVIEVANIIGYPLEKNRIDFVSNPNDHRFRSLFNMACAEIEAENKAERTSFYLPNYKKATKIAKNLFIAVANGDVAMLKRITTPKFYYDNFPSSDEETRSTLLSVPYHKRSTLVDHIRNHAITSAIHGHNKNSVKIIFTNTISNKEFSVWLIDENKNNNWKVYDSTYQFR